MSPQRSEEEAALERLVELLQRRLPGYPVDRAALERAALRRGLAVMEAELSGASMVPSPAPAPAPAPVNTSVVLRPQGPRPAARKAPRAPAPAEDVVFEEDEEDEAPRPLDEQAIKRKARSMAQQITSDLARPRVGSGSD